MKKGEGEVVESRSDMVLVRQAVNAGWAISDERKRAIVDRLFEIVSDKTATKREIISAARTLAVIDKANSPPPPREVQHTHNLSLVTRKEQMLQKLEEMKALGHGSSDGDGDNQ